MHVSDACVRIRLYYIGWLWATRGPCVRYTHAALYTTICVRILLHMCPHTTIYVSAYYCVYICVLILLVCVDRREGLVDLVTPGTLLHMCPHTVSSYCCSSVAAVAAMLQQHYLCVRILCPHTAIYVSSYCYVCVLMLLYMCHQGSLHVLCSDFQDVC